MLWFDDETQVAKGKGCERRDASGVAWVACKSTKWDVRRPERRKNNKKKKKRKENLVWKKQWRKHH